MPLLLLQGHVDNVGVIEQMRPDGDSLYVRIRPPAELMPYIVPKGFIAIDGTPTIVLSRSGATYSRSFNAYGRRYQPDSMRGK